MKILKNKLSCKSDPGRDRCWFKKNKQRLFRVRKWEPTDIAYLVTNQQVYVLTVNLLPGSRMRGFFTESEVIKNPLSLKTDSAIWPILDDPQLSDIRDLLTNRPMGVMH